MAATQARSVFHRVVYCTLLVLLMTAINQAQDCNVFRPTKYAYDRTQIENSNTDSGTCSSQDVNGRTYFICNEEGRVRDQDLGPQTLSLQDSRHYYNWTKTGGRMLFEFSRSVTLTSVILHYYLDRSNDASRPKLKLVELDNSFNLSHIEGSLPTERTPTALDALADAEVTPGLYNVTIPLRNTRAPASKLVLVVFNDKFYHFVMSEITFCTAEDLADPSTVSESSPPSSTNKGTVADMTIKSFAPKSEGISSDSSVEPQSGTSGQQQLTLSSITFLISLSIFLLLR